MLENTVTKEAPMNASPITHESYIAAIRTIVIARIQDPATRQRLADAKLCYGAGLNMGARGFTSYGSWQNGSTHDFIEICASGEESDVQIAGTTIHELGHVLADMGTGHGKEWKAACAVLGLNAVQAGGQSYAPEHFDAEIWAAIAALPVPTDGAPVFRASLPGMRILKPRPCPLGIGTRGGKSRGTGSGSRLRLWTCECGVKVRVASDDFQATCNRCGSAFTRATQPATEAA